MLFTIDSTVAYEIKTTRGIPWQLAKPRFPPEREAKKKDKEEAWSCLVGVRIDLT